MPHDKKKDLNWSPEQIEAAKKIEMAFGKKPEAKPKKQVFSDEEVRTLRQIAADFFEKQRKKGTEEAGSKTPGPGIRRR